MLPSRLGNESIEGYFFQMLLMTQRRLCLSEWLTWIQWVTVPSLCLRCSMMHWSKWVLKTAVGGAAGVIHAVDCATTDCQPNENVEALRVFMLGKKVECRPLWKPMHKQPVYAENDVYTNGVEEDLFKVGFCLPAGPYVSDDDVRYIVECIKEAIVR